MWSRRKSNVNTVTFYKGLVAKKNDTFKMKERKVFEQFLNVMLAFGYSPDMFNYTAVDKRSRLAFVDKYRAMFFNTVYAGHRNQLVEAERLISQQAAMNALYKPNPKAVVDSRRFAFNCMVFVFSGMLIAVAALTVGLLLGMADDSDSIELASAKRTLLDMGITFSTVLGLAVLVLGALKYAVWHAQKKPDAFVSQIKAPLQLERLPENPEEWKAVFNKWEAAFDKLVMAENRVREKLTLFSRKGDVEAQRMLGERSPLIQNRM